MIIMRLSLFATLCVMTIPMLPTYGVARDTNRLSDHEVARRKSIAETKLRGFVGSLAKSRGSGCADAVAAAAPLDGPFSNHQAVIASTTLQDWVPTWTRQAAGRPRLPASRLDATPSPASPAAVRSTGDSTAHDHDLLRDSLRAQKLNEQPFSVGYAASNLGYLYVVVRDATADYREGAIDLVFHSDNPHHRNQLRALRSSMAAPALSSMTNIRQLSTQLYSAMFAESIPELSAALTANSEATPSPSDETLHAYANGGPDTVLVIRNLAPQFFSPPAGKAFLESLFLDRSTFLPKPEESARPH